MRDVFDYVRVDYIPCICFQFGNMFGQQPRQELIRFNGFIWCFCALVSRCAFDYFESNRKDLVCNLIALLDIGALSVIC